MTGRKVRKAMSIRLLGLLGGVLGFAAIAALLARLVRRQEQRTNDQTHDLVSHLVAEILADKLQQPRQTLTMALAGRSADPEVRRRIDAVLRSVELTFRRTGSLDTAELKIAVQLEDGETQSARPDRCV